MARTNKSAEMVKELRDRFMCEYEKVKYDDIYDEQDLALVNDDWYVKRFLLATGRDVEKAFHMLDETMKWRNHMFISFVRDFHFPSEFYQIGAMFLYEPDRNGHLVLYMRIKFHHFAQELDEPTRGFVVHNFNKAEKMAKGQGFAVVFDLTSAGYSNLDLPFLSYLINFGKNHFPGSLSYILVYNLPWVLSAAQKLAFAMMPAETLGIIKFGRGEDIFQYIAPENCPDYIPGGCCKRNYRKMAPGSKPILDLVMHYGYTRETYDRIFPTFRKDLEEAMRCLSEQEYEDPPEGFFDDITGVEITPLPLPSRRVREPKKRPVDLIQGEFGQDLVPKKVLISLSTSNFMDFVYEGTCYVSELDMTNQTDEPVAFKILSTHPNQYSVSPFKGIIRPRASLRVTTTFLAPKSSSIPSGKNKFLVVSAAVSTQSMTPQEFAAIWTDSNQERGMTYKLRARINFADSDGIGAPTKGTISDRVDQMSREFRYLKKKYSNLVRMFYLLVILLFVTWFLLFVSAVGGGGDCLFQPVMRHLPFFTNFLPNGHP